MSDSKILTGEEARPRDQPPDLGADAQRRETLQLDVIEQHLRTVKDSLDWADVVEILDWYQLDVAALLLERGALKKDLAQTTKLWKEADADFAAQEAKVQAAEVERDQARQELQQLRGGIDTQKAWTALALETQKRAERAEADLASARQALEQLRAACAALPRYAISGEIVKVRQISAATTGYTPERRVYADSDERWIEASDLLSLLNEQK